MKSRPSTNDFQDADREPLIFIGNINPNKQGKYGTYDYEVHVPVLLRLYNLSTQTQLKYYVELR